VIKKQQNPPQNSRPKESEGQNQSPMQNKDPGGNSSSENEQGELAEGNDQIEKTEEQIFKAAFPLSPPQIKFEDLLSEESAQSGRRSSAVNAKRGLYVGSEAARNTTDIAIDVTVLNALTRNPDQLDITIDDLHRKKRSGKTGNLILFVVDASGSMAASKRMEAVKGTVIGLLTDAYQNRDAVSVIAFRGIEAQLLLSPTQSIEFAEEAMRSLPTGGRTPLPHALQMAVQLLQRLDQTNGYKPILVILTDGKANVALPGGGDAWEQTSSLAAQLKKLNIRSMVLNTDLNYFNLNRAEELAKTLGGQYLSLQDISKEQLTPIINQLRFPPSTDTK